MTKVIPVPAAPAGPCITSEAHIDAALEDSFPASDPPWWTLGVASASLPANGETELIPAAARMGT